MRDWPDPLIVIVSIVPAIMVLTLFFKAMNWVERKTQKDPTKVAFKGILDEKTPATVYLGGERVENVFSRDSLTQKHHSRTVCHTSSITW
jgi:hypothetical protein